MEEAGENLVDLCKYSFDKRARLGPANPTIVDMARYKGLFIYYIIFALHNS